MIYVDDAAIPWRGRTWYHLYSDDEEELHQFARRLGLRREWYQGDHYDITASKRVAAIKLGATSVTVQEIARMRMRKRAGEDQGVQETD